MRATIERATLLKSLSHVQSVVERRNTIPILSNVLIEASDGGKIKITATDLDLQVVETFAAEVETPGATTVSAHTLFEIARKLPDGSQVQLHAADGRMAVNAGRARFSLATLPRDDFPMIAEGELPTSFEIPASSLIQIIDKTRFAISTEETRYYLNGIFLHVTEDAEPVLKAAATDGHRLARVTLPAPGGCRGHARHHRPPQMRWRNPQAARRKRRQCRSGRPVGEQDPLHLRQRHPDLEADRRHLPRLQPRHPDRERQAAAHRPQGIFARRRPRRHHRHRKDPRGQDGARQGQDNAVGNEPRRTARRPKKYRANIRATASKSASTRAI